MLALIHLLKGRTSQLLLILFLGFSVAACGGGSSGGGGTTPPPGGGGGGGGGGGADDDPPTAEISPADNLGSRESIVVTFSEPMDAESLELGGSLAEEAVASWSDDNVTLTLAPSGYWKPGSQDLSISGTDAGGEDMDEAESAQFNVAAPFATFQNASRVIGQPDFESTQARQGSDTSAHANTLDLPLGAVAYAADENILFVNDSHTSRVLGFNGIPETNNASADLVVGQNSFSASEGRVAADGLTQPQSVTANGGNLVIADAFSNRVLIYDGVPIAGPVEASVVLGQDSMTSSESGCAPNRLHRNHIHGHFVTPDGKLIVADSGNNRVLIWNTMPTENAQEPDMVLGQNSFTSCASNDNDQNGATDVDNIPSARTMDHPTNVWTDGDRLFVVDQENHRVLIWNEFPTENFAEADVVLGQSAMNMNTRNDDDQDGVDDGAGSPRTMFNPWDVRVVHGQLIVTDMDNNRVLIWNSVPAESFAPADVVLGQADFAGIAENAGGAAAANTLNRPAGVQVVNGELYVTDWENSRVLVFEPQD